MTVRRGTRCRGRLRRFAFWVVLVLAAAGGAAFAAAPTERLTIETAAGPRAFTIEVARTPDEQATGLMYRRTLAPDAGMLFLYAPGSRITMWMKNTLIPLDMLFIAADGRIAHIAERTVPLSTEFIGSNGPVRAVLEVNAGTASRLGIKVGDRVRHAAFQ